jgi:hypothetical protein
MALHRPRGPRQNSRGGLEALPGGQDLKSKVTAGFICAVLLLVCGCFRSLEEAAPREEKRFAITYIDSVRAGNLEAARRYLHPSVDTSDIDMRILEVARSFPSGPPLEVKTIGFKLTKRAPDGVTETDLSFQYEFEDGWVLARVSLERDNVATFVKGLNVQPLSESLSRAHAFTIKGKSTKHYVFLGLAIAIPAFIIFCFVLCLRTPMKRLKWLWAMFVLMGIGLVGFNWTTGDIAEYNLTARFLGMRILSESSFSPWIVKVLFPLGAIVFLVKRKTLARKASE